MKINLHTHTDYSIDGSISVRDLMIAAEQEGFEYFSITDHNSVDAYYDEAINKPFTGKLIVGIELDALIDDVGIEILGYNIDLEKINKWCLKTYGNRNKLHQAMFNELERLCDKHGLKRDRNIEYQPDLDYPHAGIYDQIITANQKWLESYNIKSSTDFYRLSTTDKTFPLFIDMNKFWPTVDEVINAIHDAGGLAFLAHPHGYHNLDVDWLLDSLKNKVDGIEIFNSRHNPEQAKSLYDYALKHNLLMSIGSDYHGPKKPAKLNCEIDPKLETEVLKWLGEV